MIDHDRLFKELLTTFFWEFIELFLPEVAAYLDRESITFMDKEIFTDVTAGERYEADLLVKAKFRGQECIVILPDYMKNTNYQYIRSPYFPTTHQKPQSPIFTK